MRNSTALAALLAALAAAPALAADAGKPAPNAPPPPQIGVDDGRDAEPDVPIRQEGDKKIEEYRVNGKLYAVKVTPKVGPPYYLVDQKGDGELTPYDVTGRGKLKIPHWVLFTF